MTFQIDHLRKRCSRLVKNRNFRLWAGVVLFTTGLYLYAFVLCRAPIYVDQIAAHNLYISLSHEGRIGNQMFKYAALLGIANKTGRKPIVSLSFPLLDLFDLTHVKDIDNRCWVVTLESLSAAFDDDLHKLPLTNTTVGLYLQSWKYFDHIQTTIRHEYKFKSPIISQAKYYFEKYRNVVSKQNTPVVGVHVRRGDHLISKFHKLGYTIPDLAYFDRAMTYMRSRLGNVTFLVVGDDLPWIKDNFKSADIVIADDLSAGVHLALLSLCDHMIQSTGTFSWWAGWFVRGHVVYYKNYPAAGSWLESEMKKEDHYPPQWVAL